jgi:hypothetical protein
MMTAVQIQARAQQEKRRRKATSGAAGAALPVWAPYPDWPDRPHPQRQAYGCKADILGYGSEAGGGKTDLLLGLAGTRHWRAIIFRREFPRLSAMIDRSREIYNALDATSLKDSFNENLHRWRLRDGRQIEFAAMQQEKDKLGYQGRPHDLYGFDEVTEFSESQVRFVIGWNRSTHIDAATGKPQRCRVVMTFNPPMDEAGEWVIAFFLPWLAHLHPDEYQHPNPAKPGELRWYATVNGKDAEIPEDQLQYFAEREGQFWEIADSEPFQLGSEWIVPIRGYVQGGALVRAKSRTFIPASLRDNPKLEATGYASTIDAMPEPYRSLLKGMWGAGKVTDPWQLIPAAWVRAAEKRYQERPTPDVALQSVGGDVARGGKDRFSIAKLYGNWLAPIECYPGVLVDDGPKGAALLIPYWEQKALIGVDVISVGSSVYDSLIGAGVKVNGVNAAEGCPNHRSRSGLKFKNVRAAMYWKLREAFDPDHGDDMAVPADPELREELCAHHFKITAAGIQIEAKEDIVTRIGRSPDKAESLAIALWNVVGARKPPPVVPPTGMTRTSPWR